jgi:hypothetical protein
MVLWGKMVKDLKKEAFQDDAADRPALVEAPEE